MTEEAMKQGLEACKVLKRVLERTRAQGIKEIKDVAVSYQFVEHLEKAYKDESLVKNEKN